MNKKFYVFAVLGAVLLFYSLFSWNKYIDSYNYQKYVANMYDEIRNHVLTETESDSIHLDMEMELTSFNNNPCPFKEVIHPDTAYLILTVPMSYWVQWTFELIKKLETEKERIPCVQTIVIVYGSSLRDMKVKVNSFKELLPVYMTPLDNIGLPASKPDIPYLIFTNDGKKVQHTLTFERGSTKFLSEYIGILSEKYCEQTNMITEKIEEK